jgi:hypothetical protein
LLQARQRGVAVFAQPLGVGFGPFRRGADQGACIAEETAVESCALLEKRIGQIDLARV